MGVGDEVSGHYGRGKRESAVVAVLRMAGLDPEHISTADLEGADDLHFGWRPATLAVAASLNLPSGAKLLDIGCGVGGPARLFAERFGCHVTGVDLTPEFIALARSLTRRCGLADRADFVLADATDLPLPADAFDAAVQLHVGMNLPDKRGVFTEVQRVLRKGGRFIVFDVMRTGRGELSYPVPWALTPRTSFVDPPDRYRSLLEEAGFTVEQETDRRDMVLAVARERREAAASKPPSPMQSLLGAAAPERLANALRAMESGLIAPIEMVATAH
jgi:ubiquinone/menaquinone biosynthesis C-methylase UbiE